MLHKFIFMIFSMEGKREHYFQFWLTEDTKAFDLIRMTLHLLLCNGNSPNCKHVDLHVSV
jgi:hypothetical protein